MARALAVKPENPRVHLIQGTSLYYTPEQWSGGKEKAKVALEEAVRLYALDSPEPAMPDWGHSEAYGWLGWVKLEMGERDAAKSHWDKALEIDPENGWVKFQLMPKLKKN